SHFSTYSTSWSANINATDSTFTGAWPLTYKNERRISRYDKNKIPLIPFKLDSINTDLRIEREFGHYSCKIEENERYIIVEQELYVSGALSIDRAEEFDLFKKERKDHLDALKKLILTEAPEEKEQEQPIEKSKKRKKKKERKKKELKS
ncbi:MAG: hypothetical protein AAF696_29385, partial [Bacteroidota bacterium]